MFWAFLKSIFQFFDGFWLRKLRPFFRKLSQNVKNYLNQNMVKESFLRNGFKATLRSKTNNLSVWKDHFLVLWKFLCKKAETIFWESEVKHWKLFKWKFVHRKFLTNLFLRYLEIKTEGSECLKRPFFNVLQVFLWRSWNHFWKSQAKCPKLFKSKFGYRKLLRKRF